jgi:hypothetical protein
MGASRYKCLICGNESRFRALADARVEIIVDGSGSLLSIDMDQVVENADLKISEVTDCLNCGASGPKSIIDQKHNVPGESNDAG